MFGISRLFVAVSSLLLINVFVVVGSSVTVTPLHLDSYTFTEANGAEVEKRKSFVDIVNNERDDVVVSITISQKNSGVEVVTEPLIEDYVTVSGSKTLRVAVWCTSSTAGTFEETITVEVEGDKYIVDINCVTYGMTGGEHLEIEIDETLPERIEHSLTMEVTSDRTYVRAFMCKSTTARMNFCW